MALVNENFLKLPVSYLFTDIARKVNAFRITHPDADIIRLGIGDVTRPLAPAVIAALHKATDEMASASTFRGYGPEHGYDFLREAIIKNDFAPRGIHLDPMEVFINDGAKSDTGNIGDILGLDNTLCMTDPIYPVYVDSNAMCGRAGTLSDKGWSNIIYCPCNAENNFIPALPDQRVDVIYLCYPNNPTGTVITRQELKRWVDYAIKNDSIIMYDAAYEAYIQEPGIPHSIYEIPKAKVPATSSSGLPKPPTLPKARSRCRTPSSITCRMRASCWMHSPRWACRSSEASTLPTSGCAHPKAPPAGSSSTNSCTALTS